MLSEMKTKKQRPKTHRSRSRVRTQSRVTMPLRPKTTRSRAPISYNDLELLRDNSSTSNECSPTRNGFGSHVAALNSRHRSDQYSLLSIQTSKFMHLDFNDSKITKSKNNHVEKFDHSENNDEMYVIIPPKPSLSIIDFNQLTRGGLEQAKRSTSNNRVRSTSRIEGYR